MSAEYQTTRICRARQRNFIEFSQSKDGSSVVFDNNQKTREMRLDQGIPEDGGDALVQVVMDAGNATATFEIENLPEKGRLCRVTGNCDGTRQRYRSECSRY